jgi:hypothetical protein
MKLHTYGLLGNSFRPSQEIRTMRSYWLAKRKLKVRYTVSCNLVGREPLRGPPTQG